MSGFRCSSQKLLLPSYTCNISDQTPLPPFLLYARGHPRMGGSILALGLGLQPQPVPQYPIDPSLGGGGTDRWSLT